MRIEIRGRNVEVTEELREHVAKRFQRVGKQVSDLALLDVERTSFAANAALKARVRQPPIATALDDAERLLSHGDR